MIDKRVIKTINNCICDIANGKTKGLEKLFEITKKPLYVVAKSYLYDKSKAEDILSESYIKVVKNANSFDPKFNGYNWLYEIVKNTALNQNEKDRRILGEPIENIDFPDYKFLDEVLNKILVEDAKKLLNDDEKLLIYEYYFDGLSLQEIAQKHGIGKTTVYDFLQRTLTKIKNNLI